MLLPECPLVLKLITTTIQFSAIQTCCCFSVLCFGYATTFLLAQKPLFPLAVPCMCTPYPELAQSCHFHLQKVSSIHLILPLVPPSQFRPLSSLPSSVVLTSCLFVSSLFLFPSSQNFQTQLLIKNFEIIPHCLQTKALAPHLAFKVLSDMAPTAFEQFFYPYNLSLTLFQWTIDCSLYSLQISCLNGLYFFCLKTPYLVSTYSNTTCLS